MLLNILTSFWKVFLLSAHLCHANHPAEEFCPHPKYAPRERDLLISAWEALVPFSILGQKAARKGLSHWAMDFPELQSWEGLQHPMANPWQINLIYLTRVQKVLSHPQQPSWCPREEGTILHVSKQCNSPSLQHPTCAHSLRCCTKSKLSEPNPNACEIQAMEWGKKKIVKKY